MLVLLRVQLIIKNNHRFLATSKTFLLNIMFASAIKKTEKAMFPIFRIDQISLDKSRVNVAGTGFFINSNGVFISVSHVFENITPQTKFLFLGFLPNNLSNPPLEIEEVARDNQNDIFVGKIKTKTPNFLKLLNKIPPIGRSACIGGYPLAVITNNENGGLELGGVRRYFQPSFVLDHLKMNVDDGKGTMKTHDGFSVRDFGLFGMSGGPVFDKNATILGMQASVTNPRVSSNGSRSITVENAVAIRSNLIFDLLRDNGVDTE